MKFPSPAGWHVLIGDNGAGKSTIIRSIALALVGPDEALGLRADWRDWLNYQAQDGRIHLQIKNDTQTTGLGPIPNDLVFTRRSGSVLLSSNKNPTNDIDLNPYEYNWNPAAKYWFSAAYGPYRRFAGGNQEWTSVFKSQGKLGAHLSAFGEDVALTEAIEWLVKLNYQVLEKKQPETIIDDIKLLMNSPDFLPHGTKIDSISSDGVFFKDGNGSRIHVNQLSDGYRSVLSLTFELIRQLVKLYDADAVFKDIRKANPENMQITLPGVVLIDEIDAHLHPSWQTRIGQWFMKYFPMIQFIVTTHSPLICRASEKGSIWRLAAPGALYESGEITGKEKDRLIFGNILDAYGTDIFGENVSISEESSEKINRLAELNIKSIQGQTNGNEEKELRDLKTIFPTEQK